MSRFLNIHEAYNARTKSIDDICNSFIVNDEFRELAGANNSILVGPRGSGKTTLMKMLQFQALTVWNGVEADRFKNNINYYGVFIRTDRIWKMQYDKLRSFSDRSGDGKFENYIQSLFTYHVLEQVVSTLNFIISKERSCAGFGSFSKMDEASLVAELRGAWSVDPKVPSLKSLAISIAFKKNEISTYLSSIYRESSGAVGPDILTGSLTDIIGPSISAINIFLQRDIKWALLFDELELAPSEIIQPLIDSMRGGEDSIILKLSLSPYHADVGVGSDIYSTMMNQDVSIVNLSDVEREENRRKEFCKRLSENTLKNYNISGDIEDKFVTPDSFDVVKVFEEYSRKSDEFERYLEKIGISISEIPNYDESGMAPVVRRFKHIVYLLNARTKDDGRFNSAKRADDYYGGFYNLCRQVEYNPRMLIGLMNSFVEEISQGNKISLSKQISFLNRMVESYVSMLQTIPINIVSSNANLYDFINVIGSYFEDSMYVQKFKSEPLGSFSVDSDSAELNTAIGYAWNSGAIILENGEKAGKIYKARFRLSYIFSHKFGLSTVLGRQCKLGEILSNKKGSNDIQMSLSFHES